MIFNHGIAAFIPNIQKDYVEIIKNTTELANGEHPNWTLSCSRDDQYLGKVGFSCTGYCVEMYECSCHSTVNKETGERKANPECAPYKCDAKGWYASEAAYTEALVNEINITGFWMDYNFYGRFWRNCAKRANKTLAEYDERDKMFSGIEKLVMRYPELKIVRKVMLQNVNVGTAKTYYDGNIKIEEYEVMAIIPTGLGWSPIL